MECLVSAELERKKVEWTGWRAVRHHDPPCERVLTCCRVYGLSSLEKGMSVLMVADEKRLCGPESTRYGFPVTGCAWYYRIVVGGRRHSAGV